MTSIEFGFQTPPYAKGMFWLTGADGFQSQIEAGAQFTPPVVSPQSPLMLRWGTPDGSPLCSWGTSAETFDWDGEIRLGGHVEVSHLITLNDMEVMIVEVTGKLLSPQMQRLPTIGDLRKAPFQRQVYFSYDDAPDYWYAFLVLLENPLSDFAHHALVNGHAIDCYGAFAAQKAGFHKLVGIPLVLESMTLYGT